MIGSPTLDPYLSALLCCFVCSTLLVVEKIESGCNLIRWNQCVHIPSRIRKYVSHGTESASRGSRAPDKRELCQKDYESSGRFYPNLNKGRRLGKGKKSDWQTRLSVHSLPLEKNKIFAAKKKFIPNS
jgi:hypothetical protein